MPAESKGLVKRHAEGITHNTAGSIVATYILQGVPSVISWITAQAAYVRGLELHWAILLGVLVFALASFSFNQLRQLFARVPLMPVDAAPESHQLTEADHEDCRRQIRNHESTIARLQRNDQTQGIQISSRNARIEQLENEIKGFSWLRDIAAKQAASMHRYVSIQDCQIRQHELFRHDPYLDFWILVGNRSVFDIRLTDIAGVISFYGRELTEGREWKTPDRVVTWGDKESFSFRQRLNRDDVVQLLNEREDFRFDGLKIPAISINQSEFSVQLERIEFDNIALINDALLTAYPKVEIESKVLLCSFIVNLETWNAFDQDGILTMHIGLTNKRPMAVTIDTFHLSITVKGNTHTVAAEVGEIWTKKYIDKEGVLRTEGPQLDNLASKTPLRITQAKRVGDLQFIFSGIGAAMLNHQVSYELVLTDIHGETHKLNGTTGKVDTENV